MRAVALLAAVTMLAGPACRTGSRNGQSPADGVDMPAFIGRPPAELGAAMTRQLGLAPDGDLRAAGLEIEVKRGKVDAVFIHVVSELEGGAVYRGPLFRGLAPTMRQVDVEARMGLPDARSEPGAKPMFPAVSGSWIKYLRPEAQIHFEFAGEGGPIRMITLIRPDWKPGDK